jgi:hypothetical protein
MAVVESLLRLAISNIVQDERSDMSSHQIVYTEPAHITIAE